MTDPVVQGNKPAAAVANGRSERLPSLGNRAEPVGPAKNSLTDPLFLSWLRNSIERNDPKVVSILRDKQIGRLDIDVLTGLFKAAHPKNNVRNPTAEEWKGPVAVKNLLPNVDLSKLNYKIAPALVPVASYFILGLKNVPEFLSKQQKAAIKMIESSPKSVPILQARIDGAKEKLDDLAKKLPATSGTDRQKILLESQKTKRQMERDSAVLVTTKQYVAAIAPVLPKESPIVMRRILDLREQQQAIEERQGKLRGRFQAGTISKDNYDRQMASLGKISQNTQGRFYDLPRGVMAQSMFRSKFTADTLESGGKTFTDAIKSLNQEFTRFGITKYLAVNGDLSKIKIPPKSGSQDSTEEFERNKTVHDVARYAAARRYLSNAAKSQFGVVTAFQVQVSHEIAAGSVEPYFRNPQSSNFAPLTERELRAAYADPKKVASLAEKGYTEFQRQSGMLDRVATTGLQVAGTVGAIGSGQVYAVPAIWLGLPTAGALTRAYVEDKSVLEAAKKEWKENGIYGSPSSVLGQYVRNPGDAWKLVAIDLISFAGAERLAFSAPKAFAAARSFSTSDLAAIKQWSTDRFGRILNASELEDLKKAFNGFIADPLSLRTATQQWRQFLQQGQGAFAMGGPAGNSPRFDTRGMFSVELSGRTQRWIGEMTQPELAAHEGKLRGKLEGGKLSPQEEARVFAEWELVDERLAQHAANPVQQTMWKWARGAGNSISGFKDSAVRAFAEGGHFPGVDPKVLAKARDQFQVLSNVVSRLDFDAFPPGWRFESLGREGQRTLRGYGAIERGADIYSIRVNDQYRIVFSVRQGPKGIELYDVWLGNHY